MMKATRFCVVPHILLAGSAMSALALSCPASAQTATPDTPNRAMTAADESEDGSDIIVTAQKRSERLRDVPLPVTAITGSELTQANQSELRDYFTKVPGLALTDAGIYGGTSLVIRGISTGILDAGTTSVVVDDVPYGISANPGGPTSVVPELDPSDLSRIEVLRGPQGTLYGASSMGGLLKYVTIDPSTERFSGYVRGGLSGVHNGDGAGYNVGVGLNIPLGADLAVRVTGTARRSPGYIDDPVHNIDGVNASKLFGGRAALLWRLADGVSLRLGALYQDTKMSGNDYVGPTSGFGPIGDLQQVAPPKSGGYHKVLQVYTAHLTAQLGKADITSITAYTLNKAFYRFDVTPVFAPIVGLFVPGSTGAYTTSSGTTRRFTQELRAQLSLSDAADLLIGGFYAYEKNPRINYYIALDAATGRQLGQIGSIDFPSTYREKAAFTDFTYRFSPQFDVQIGGRLAYMTTVLPYNETTGPLFGGGAFSGRIASKDHAFTYLVTPRFKPSEDLMIYARVASGYRPGAPNLGASTAGGLVPLSFRPDKTLNYEIGAKGSAFNRLLTFDISAYYIDWKNIQLQSLFLPSVRLNFKDNGGNAVSKGIELAAELRPVTGLSLTINGAFSSAKLSEDFPAVSTVAGRDGDRLPFSSKFSGSVTVEYRFPVRSGVEASVGLVESYVGNRKGPFVASGTPRADLPHYYNTDFRAGLSTDVWDVSFYINNLTDRRGLLSGGAGTFLPDIFSYTRPRIIGVSGAVRF